MKPRAYWSRFMLVMVGLISMACLLPGMIPLPNGTPSPTPGPRPAMEKSAEKVIQVLNGNNYVRLDALAKERYTEQDYAKPGTLTFTVKIADTKPVYFSFAWCTANSEILQQNVEHIKVSLYFNGGELGKDVVHGLSFTSADNMACADAGVLMSDWPAGQYKLKAVETFDQKINDGVSDYEAGDYIQEYTVDVQK